MNIRIENGHLVVVESFKGPNGDIGSSYYFPGSVPDIQKKYKVDLETGLFIEV